MQQKYGKTGKFEIVLSHVQSYDKKAIDEYLKKAKATFTSYQQLRPSNAKGNGGLPYMVLFYHKGNVVAKDNYIRDLENQIKKLIKATPEPVAYAPLFEAVYVLHNRPEVKALRIGKGIKGALAGLDRKAQKKNPAGIEAAEIIKAVNSWGKMS